MTSVNNEDDMKSFGRRLGEQLHGGEVLELVGDVGAGKTTLVKGIGQGLEIDEDVQSPSFTISRVYQARDGLELHHYDFYRLGDAGIMSYELEESVNDPKVITIIEWAQTVQDVLPVSRGQITISYTPEGEGRTLQVQLSDKLKHLKAN